MDNPIIAPVNKKPAIYAIPYNENFPKPKELDKEGIQRIVTAFVAAAKRALRAGFDVIEIHNAHGYLLDSFISPATNKRADEYGGSFENRIRLTLEIVDAVRAVIPPSMPLFLRISATDWLEESLPNEPSWRSEDTVRLAGILAEHGVDLLDVSSGGLHPQQKIKGGPAYQAPFAEAVKKAHGDKILVGTVGNITHGHTAQSVLEKGQADVVFVGLQFQKNPGTVWAFAEDLGVTLTIALPLSIGMRATCPRPAHRRKQQRPEFEARSSYLPRLHLLSDVDESLYDLGHACQRWKIQQPSRLFILPPM
ncbi:FMN-linked oxidoreductase, partial [Cubamyces sp. BRFM 1775]